MWQKGTCTKNYLTSFFCIFNRIFLVLRVLYERNCSTKGTAQLLKLLFCTEIALFFVTVSKIKEIIIIIKIIIIILITIKIMIIKRLYFDRLEKLVLIKTDTGISHKLHKVCNSIAPSTPCLSTPVATARLTRENAKFSKLFRGET